MSSTLSPSGYITSADIAKLQIEHGPCVEPAEIADVKNAVQEILDTWENSHGILSFHPNGTGHGPIELADEIIESLINNGVAFPEKKTSAANLGQLPSVIEANLDLLRTGDGLLRWGQPTGEDHGAVAITSGEHTLFHGFAGYGKTNALRCIAYAAIAQGFEVTIIDTVAGGIEWDWLDDDARIATTIHQAVSTLDHHIRENRHAHAVLTETGATSLKHFDEAARQRYGLRKRLIILDSVLEHISTPDLTAPHLSEDLQTLYDNVETMLRESRALGATVVATSQMPPAHLPSALVDNFSSHIHLGRAYIKTDDDSEITSVDLPRGVAYILPGEFTAQAWLGSVETLTEALEDARLAGAQPSHQ